MQLDTFVVGVDPENSWQLNLTVDFVWLARRRRRRKDRNDVLSHSWTQDGPVYKFRDRQKGCRRSGRTFSRPINGAKPVEHLLNFFFALVLFTADEISLWNATKFPSAWVEKNNAYISPLIIELFRLFVVTKVVRWTRNRRPWKKSICKLWRNPKLLEFSWLESGYLAIPPTYRMGVTEEDALISQTQLSSSWRHLLKFRRLRNSKSFLYSFSFFFDSGGQSIDLARPTDDNDEWFIHHFSIKKWKKGSWPFSIFLEQKFDLFMKVTKRVFPSVVSPIRFVGGRKSSSNIVKGSNRSRWRRRLFRRRRRLNNRQSFH